MTRENLKATPDLSFGEDLEDGETVWLYDSTHEWEDHGAGAYSYVHDDPAGDRFRIISVELFSELLDLTTAESSISGLQDMLKSCDWVVLRTEALKSEILDRLGTASSTSGGFEELTPGGISFLVGNSTEDGPVTVGTIEVPVEAIARFVDAGIDTDKIIEMWQGKLTDSDIESAVRLFRELNPEQ